MDGRVCACFLRCNHGCSARLGGPRALQVPSCAAATMLPLCGGGGRCSGESCSAAELRGRAALVSKYKNAPGVRSRRSILQADHKILKAHVLFLLQRNCLSYYRNVPEHEAGKSLVKICAVEGKAQTDYGLGGFCNSRYYWFFRPCETALIERSCCGRSVR